MERFYDGLGFGGAYKNHYEKDIDNWYKNKDKYDETEKIAAKLLEYDKDVEYNHKRRAADACLFQTGYYGYNGVGTDLYWEESKLGGGFGTFNSDYAWYTFTSDITGKTFYIINQNASKNGRVILPGQCNRASGAIILSGYYSGTIEELIDKTQRDGSGFPYNNTNLYNGSGLSVTNASGEIENYQTYVETQLKNGNYILMRFNTPTIGKSGATWSGSDGHWIAIIGYTQEDGKKKIAIADPGWGANKSHWYDIDEFENNKSTMQYLYLVTPPKE